MLTGSEDYPYLQRQRDELEALSFIIPPGDLTILSEEPPLKIQLRFTDDDYNPSDPSYCPLLLTVTLQQYYPVRSQSPNGRLDLAFDYELVKMKDCPDLYALSRWLSLPDKRKIIRTSIDLCRQSNGEEVLFDLYQQLKDTLPFPRDKQTYDNLQTQREGEHDDARRAPSHGKDNEDDNDDDDDDDEDYLLWAEMNDMDVDKYHTMIYNKYKHQEPSPSSASSPSSVVPIGTHALPPVRNLMSIPCTPEMAKRVESKIVRGDRLVVKKSVFESFLYPITSIQDVVECMAYLYQSKHFCVATHNMIVYRYLVPPPSGASGEPAVVLNCDEDGEKAAGRKMAMVMAQYDAQCLVVVSRHYGGIMLGPDRFKIIAHQVQQMLDSNGYLKLKS